MDLSAIQTIITESFGSMNIWAIVTGLISGVLVKILWDNILAWVLVKYWPEKYLQIFYGWISEFNTNVLNKLPDKTRKVVEGKLEEFLEKLQEIIES
jgi:hypothetical protein